MKKSRLIFGILAMLILATLATAGTPQTKKGATSVFYDFGGLAATCIDNNWLGAQYLLFDKTGVGFQLCLYYDREKLTDDDEPETNSSLGFDVYGIHYPFQKGPVALWIAPDLGFMFSSNRDKDADMVCKTRDIWIGGSIGVEWWLFEQVSLSASNWFGLEFYFENNDINNVTTKPTYTSLGLLGSSSSTFNISFYFR